MENKPKRKSKTSTAVKDRYNKKTYDVISCRVKKDVAADFKAKCLANGVPQSKIIKQAIEEFLKNN